MEMKWQLGQVFSTWRVWWSCLCVLVLFGVFGSRLVIQDLSYEVNHKISGILRATATDEPHSQIREPQLPAVSAEGCLQREEVEVDVARKQELEHLRLRVWQQELILRRHRTNLRKLDKDAEDWKRDHPEQVAEAGDLLDNYRIEAGNLLQELSKAGSDLGSCLGDFHNLPNVSCEHVKSGGNAVCLPDGIREAIQRLPPGIVHATTDLYRRNIYGVPDEMESAGQPKNLLAMAVGIMQKINVDKMIQKFPAENFTILLFHYDESSYQEWNEFDWNSRALHIQVPQQGKWWYAKRFLHPGLVAPYDYIFYFDEDLDLESFDSLRYLDVMKRHELEISQPALFPYFNVHYDLTRLVNGSEVHRRTNRIINKFFKNRTMCREGSDDIPCAGFVEMMAPVFTRKAWKCVWHMIQNDLVLGWAMDWKFGACANGPAHENIGIVDTDFVAHMSTRSLGGEGGPKIGKAKTMRGKAKTMREKAKTMREKGKTMREKVTARSWMEYDLFLERWAAAEKQVEMQSLTNT